MADGLSLILLAGGLGTRLRGLYPDLPKPMVPVAGRPFLEWILRYWAAQGVADFVLSTGHRSDAIDAFVRSAPIPGARIRQHVETSPLGTGGAVRAAALAFPSGDAFLVANGDSLVLADLHGSPGPLSLGGCDAVMLAVNVDDASRYGSVKTGARGELIGFEEKRPGRGLVNAGVYLFSRRVLELFPDGAPLSMETQVFPALLQSGATIRVEAVTAPFLDIGTPDSLALAEKFVLSNLDQFGLA